MNKTKKNTKGGNLGPLYTIDLGKNPVFNKLHTARQESAAKKKDHFNLLKINKNGIPKTIPKVQPPPHYRNMRYFGPFTGGKRKTRKLRRSTSRRRFQK